jgi:PAS domain S-box-containing protein
MNSPVQVLLIEDNPGDARLVREMLSQAGRSIPVELTWVDRLDKGLQCLGTSHVDAILLDLSLPDSTSPDTLQRVLRAAPSIPVIVMMGMADERVATEAVRGGAQDYLIKGDMDGRLLTRAIHYAIERQRGENRIQSVIEAMNTSLVMADARGTILLVNLTTEKLFGYSRDELIGQSIERLFPARYQEEYSDGRVIFLITPDTMPMGSRHGELYGLRKDGTEFPIEIGLNSIETEQGRMVLASIIDLTEQKRARTRIHQLASIVESSEDAIIGKTLDGIITSWNRGAEKIYGYSAEEILNQPVSILMPSERQHELPAILGKITKGERIEHFETERLRKDGIPISVSVTYSPIRDGQGTPIGVSAIARDITERKRAEENMRLQDQVYRTVLQAASDLGNGVSVANEKAQIVFVNEAFCKICGYTEQELFDIPSAWALISAKYLPLLQERFARRLQGEAVPSHYDFEIIHKDGQIVNVEFAVNRIPLPEGVRFVIFLRDITERKRAEQANSFLATIVESSEDAIIGKTLDGIITSWNRGAEKIYGYSAEEMLNQPVSMLMPSERQHELPAILDKITKGERIEHFETERIRKDGTVISVSVTFSPIRDEKGTPIGVSAIARDITERKEAEKMMQAKNEELKAMSQQLWQAAKLATMGELAASIAHELNNPLATVSLRTEMLQVQFAPEDPQSKSLQVIDSEIKRMSSLVGNLLQFSRRSSSQISTIQVNEELANTLELIQYHLRKNSIHTVPKLSSEIPLIQADRQQLRQVFLNLFTNAADAMPLGGLLTIRTWSGEKPEAGITSPLRHSTAQSLGLPVSDVQKLFIEVSDTGEGISPDKLERVWEPFYTTKPEGKGTGLGLAICRRIIQEHGGTIEIFSDGIPGKGTTARVTLPAMKAS